MKSFSVIPFIEWVERSTVTLFQPCRTLNSSLDTGAENKLKDNNCSGGFAAQSLSTKCWCQKYQFDWAWHTRQLLSSTETVTDLYMQVWMMLFFFCNHAYSLKELKTLKTSKINQDHLQEAFSYMFYLISKEPKYNMLHLFVSWPESNKADTTRQTKSRTTPISYFFTVPWQNSWTYSVSEAAAFLH